MHEKGKEAAAQKAIEFIKDGMIVGLGSGSTAEIFIKLLVERVKSGLSIRAVASSRRSADIAKKGGIEVLDINTVPRIDLTVDGADEIDPKKRMIKGGGGAHVREKILAASSSEMVVIIDESKRSDQLGGHKLPVEVIFYGSPATKAKIEELGLSCKWRQEIDETLFITENGNLILDIHFEKPPKAPEHLHESLINVPGVVDTGFFFDLAGRVIIGFDDGHTEVLS